MSNEHALLQQRLREKAHQLWEEAGRPEGNDQHFWFLAKVEIDREEAKVDKEVAGSFPASDPPSSAVVTGATGEHPAVSAAAGAEDATPAKPAKKRAK